MVVVNFVVVVSAAAFIGFLLGIHNVLTRFEENKCDMTYMFEYPQYVKISLPGKIEKRFPRYGLYAYGEGQRTEKLRQMRFDGIPVLFIPGNSGSHKQMRSLASVSLRKSIDSHSPHHFDYFAMDLNEEYSALFGGVLHEQTEFTHLCIKRILGLYRSLPSSPTSVVLVGHSMGGMIARGVFIEPDFKPSLVRLVLTIATAHSSPVVLADSYLAQYYGLVDRYWANHKRGDGEGDRHWFEEGGGGGNLSHVTFVSIGGGSRDILVRSGLVHHPAADVNALTTTIPAVWLSTDHLCSVWCKQLVLVLTRALHDSVSAEHRQISSNATELRRVFHYHLVRRSSGKHLSAPAHPARVALDPAGDWSEDLRRQYTVGPEATRRSRHVMIRLVDDVRYERLAVEAVNATPKEWAFACVAGSVQDTHRVCSDDAVNLSNESFIAPSARHRRKMLYLNLAELKRRAFTHVILRLQPSSDDVALNVDVYSTLSRRVVAALPRWLSFGSHVVLGVTPAQAVHYEVMLPGLEQAWQAYALAVVPTACEAATHHATATLVVPWGGEGHSVHVTESLQESMPLTLHTPRPASYNGTDSPLVRLVLDPSCKYTVRIQSSLLSSLGQQTRFYAPLLPAYVAAVLLLTLRHQLDALAATGHCPGFHSALCDGAKPYYVLPAVKIGSKLLGTSMLAQAIAPFVPLPDSVDFLARNLDYFALPFILFAVAFAMVYLLGIVLWATALFSGHTVQKLALRLLSSTLIGSLNWSEWVLAGFSRLPLVVAAMLTALALHTCGALSLWLGAAFYFLKLCKMYEDYLEEWLKYSVRLLAKGKKCADAHDFSLSTFHCHMTVLLLWLTVALLNAPSALVWAHNYRFNSELVPDPSFEIGVTLCVCAAVVWHGSKPKPNVKYYKLVGYYLFTMSILVLTFAQTSLHLLSPLISSVFVVLSVHQLFAVFYTVPVPAIVESPTEDVVETTANEKKNN